MRRPHTRSACSSGIRETEASADTRLSKTTAPAGRPARRKNGREGDLPMPTRNSEEQRTRWHSLASRCAVRLRSLRKLTACVKQPAFWRAIIPPRERDRQLSCMNRERLRYGFFSLFQVSSEEKKEGESPSRER